MSTRPEDFAALIRGATRRQGLDPLLRALGFRPILTTLPPATRRAYGLSGESGLSDLIVAGERDGILTLLLELKGSDTPVERARLARRIRAHNPVRPLFFLFAGEGYRQLGFASFGIGGEFRQLLVDRAIPRRSDLETLAELAAREGEGGIELLHRHARALDRTRLTRQFFRDFRAQRDLVAAAWQNHGRGPGPDGGERDQLALLLLCRLLFLYFLQKPGHLNDDQAYLLGLLARWQRGEERGAPRGGGELPGGGCDSETSSEPRSFYRTILTPLFFSVLNTRPPRRGPEALALGPLPYLNGGLFDRHPLERRFPHLDLEDDLISGIFHDLLERYRFTTREAAESAADAIDEMGVDPEMLGQVFEELMAADRREASGTFFTPAAVVDRLVGRALGLWLDGGAGGPGGAGEWVADSAGERAERLAGIRVLDPACGSGAFLLGALSRISRARAALEVGEPTSYRREIVAHSLYGVDLQEDAALLCALRLWLALTLSGEAGRPEPLPNLDRKIRQGDALIDPIDLIRSGESTGAGEAYRTAGVRRILRTISPLAAQYLTAEPEDRPELQRRLNEAERELARVWLDSTQRRLSTSIAELHTLATTRDLFGELPAHSSRAEQRKHLLEERLGEVERLADSVEESGTLPFFSFDIHFAGPRGDGFDLILSNPPWIRAHRWPVALGQEIRRRYTVCRSAGWRGNAALAGRVAAAGAQVDLSLLFLERSLRLLAPGGVMAMLLPAKMIRSLYGGGGRHLLLRETRVDYLEDHSLDQRSIFRADAFTTAIVAQRREGEGREVGTRGVETQGTGTREVSGHAEDSCPEGGLQVMMIRRGVAPLSFEIPYEELPIVPGDLEAPWLIVPPELRRVIRKMQGAGTPLGSTPGLRVRRGIATGANDVFLVDEVEAKIGGLAWIRTEGYRRARRGGRPASEARRFEALIEGAVLRPLVRGGGIGAWRYESETQLIWLHDDDSGSPIPAPPRVASYLDRHEAVLRRRSGWRPGIPLGSVFRLAAETTGPKVAWRDLSANLEAVALPARVRGPVGGDVPIIPLNTIYFIPTRSHDEALLLAALLNSTPVRAFARAIAERAKDARFRFFAWTISLLPLPAGWERGPIATELLAISRAAHTLGGLSPDAATRLDEIVGSLYGLDETDFSAIERFDHWLRGIDEP